MLALLKATPFISITDLDVYFTPPPTPNGSRQVSVAVTAVAQTDGTGYERGIPDPGEAALEMTRWESGDSVSQTVISLTLGSLDASVRSRKWEEKKKTFIRKNDITAQVEIQEVVNYMFALQRAGRRPDASEPFAVMKGNNIGNKRCDFVLFLHLNNKGPRFSSTPHYYPRLSVNRPGCHLLSFKHRGNVSLSKRL